jgi:hypothetical protein
MVHFSSANDPKATFHPHLKLGRKSVKVTPTHYELPCVFLVYRFSLLIDRSQFKEFVDGQPLKAVINLEAQAK